MTASRLAGKELSTTQWVDVQANWLGVNLSDAVGGSFLAPIEWVGNVGLVNWVFRFSTVPSSGTSGAFKLTVPDIAAFPDQYMGEWLRGGAISAALLGAGVIPITTTLTSNQQVVLRGMLTAQALNY